MCRSCHATFTDWQWRLGILRQESLDARTSHGQREQAWAHIQGLAIIGLMADPNASRRPWIALARAAGTFYKIGEERDGGGERWGPRPALARASSAQPATVPGTADPSAVLQALFEVGHRFLMDDPLWPQFRQAIAALASRADSLAAVPHEVQDSAQRLSATLDDLVMANGPADLDAGREARAATLQALRSIGVPERQK
jgi:hypothetical protein